MSLYADDDLLHSDALAQPSASTSHAPADPVTALISALSQPAESVQQAEALQAAGQRYEEHPEHLPKLCAQVLPMVVEGRESLLRSWTLEMVALAVGRSALQTSLDALNRLLHSSSTATIKAVIPIFSTIHPILFRLLATSRPPQAIYDAFMSSKSRILSFVLDPKAQPQNRGVKAAAWKFVQKVLLVGTRAPPVDPRLNRGGTQDVSIAMISSNSPLNVAQLEEEAKMLQTQLVTQLFSSTDPAVLHAIFNILPVLCKARQPLASLLVPSMAHWTPAALEAVVRPAMQIRAVERALRAVLGHLGRTPIMMSFAAQLNEAIVRQKQRMDLAFVHEQQERQSRREQVQVKVEPVAGEKHPLEAETSAEGAKRAKMETVEVDVSGMPLGMVIDAVVDGLNGISGEELQRVLEAARRALQENSPDAIQLLSASFGVQGKAEEEVINPLDMDVDDDDLLLTELPEEIEDEAITVTEFHLPPPGPLPTDEKEELVISALERICLSGDELAGLPDIEVKDGVALAVQPKEAWMLVMARLATRVGRRKAIEEYVGKDFANRSKFAAVWLNEEWYSDLLNGTKNYPTHLDAVLATLLTSVEGKDRSLSTFLTSLPEITPSVITTLASLCQEPERGIVGFIALRELIETRPPVRPIALPRLLNLCTHPDRKIRYPAIKTVNRWVPESPMAGNVIAYALGIMRRLVGEDSMSSPYLTEITPESVQQHVELAFALSRRRQEMLDDIFALYPQIDAPVAEQVEGLLTPLIQSLGPAPRLLDVLRKFPDRADRLALRVVTILSGEGASSVLVNLVKGLMSERELDPRFIIPIIGELDKGEIEKQIPRIVALLNTPDTRDLVRTAFAAALQKLTPADLLVSLHDEEPGRKAAMEAIGICFSMTTVFRSDVLATALSRIADFPALPIIFLRTIIQAVRTYKSLTPFIANNIFPKLISKKVWESPPLWDGFVRVAKMIGKASFGSLLQLPKEQVRDLLEKQPTMRGDLRVFLEAKGMLRGQVNELFGEEA